MPALQFILTTAGKNAIVNANNTGTNPITITKIGIGSASWTPTAAATALNTEIKKITAIGGGAVANDTIHVTANDSSTDAYTVREIGLFTADNILVAVYSQAAAIITKGAATVALIATDLVITGVPAGSVTVGDTTFDYPQATETVKGVAEIATDAEVTAGTDNERIVTPAKLAARYVKKSGDTMTGALGAFAGSATAPGITAAGDSNTGMFFPAADTIAAGTAGAERMRITASGNVGVNTSNPASKLSVAASTSNTTPESGSHGISIYAGDNGKEMMLGYDSSTDIGYINASKSGSLRPIILQSRGGTVGIGKTNPSTTLDVNGTVTATAFSGPLTGNVTGNVTGSSASCTGNSATATNLSTNSTNWSSNGTISAVVGQLAWKNYGNNHTIFDASQSTSPSGTAINSTNAQVVWSATSPTLMGWNGVNTYGVRVDSARVADTLDSASTYSGLARAWVNFNGVGAVAIRSSRNVSSITDANVGRYTVNFAAGTFSNTNYAFTGGARQINDVQDSCTVSPRLSDGKSTSAMTISVTEATGLEDSSEVCVAFFA